MSFSLATLRCNINPFVANVLLRALSKNPLERYPDAMSFINAIEDASRKKIDKKERGSADKIETRNTTIRFTLEGDEAVRFLELTPETIESSINPYLESLTNIQRIFDEINENPPSHIRINSITQNSPVTASVEGIANAAQIVQEMIIPWRRVHAKSMAKLLEQEKQITIEKAKGEVLEIHARASKERAEKEKLLAEVALQNAQVEKLKLENEAARLKLQQEKIQLAISVLQHFNLSLPEDVKITYVVKLLPFLETIISSPLEVSLFNE